MFTWVLATIFVGAMAQRLTGMGFGLIVSPLLVVLLGPFDGIMVQNACAAAMASLVWVRVYRDVDWRRYLGLVVPAAVGVGAGSWLITVVPAPPLEVGIGSVLLLVLLASLGIRNSPLQGRGGLRSMIGGGFSSGVMTATAGVGGPAVTAYAMLSGWEMRSFTATLQPYFATLAALSLSGKFIASGGRWPPLTVTDWGAIVIFMCAGLFAADLLAHRIPHAMVRRSVTVIAILGSLTTVCVGLSHLR